VTLLAGGTIHPPAWDVAETYGDVHAEAAAELGAPWRLRPTLALRIRAKDVIGTYPFHEAAFLGGLDSLRGFPSQRFAGTRACSGTPS
jgi:hypothetical protein